MSIDWPQTLIESLAYRRCIIFIGAGVSATAIPKDSSSTSRLVGWEDFLKNANKNLIKDIGLQTEIEELIKKNDYLLALQAIHNDSDRGDYIGYLEKHFNSQLYQQSKIHEIIYDLDSRIVITTNFDKIYETYCYSMAREDGYKVITYHNKHLCDAIRLGSYIIIKAHGTIDDPQNMVFTQQQYTEAKYCNSNFYNTLRALFITNVILFIGCSLNDPDIRLLLEEVKQSGKPETCHYMLTCEDVSRIQTDHIHSNYGVKSLKYGCDHSELEKSLSGLFDDVESLRRSTVV